MRVLMAAVVTLAAAQLLDLATFMEMIDRVGPHAEANPLVAFLFGTYGLPTVAVAKITLVALLTAIVATLWGTQDAKLAIPVVVVVLVLGIGAGLVGGATNTAAIGLF